MVRCFQSKQNITKFFFSENVYQYVRNENIGGFSQEIFQPLSLVENTSY